MKSGVSSGRREDGCVPSSTAARGQARNEFIERYPGLPPMVIESRDRLTVFIDELIQRDQQCHHPVFEYLERTANCHEIEHFVAHERYWSLRDAAGEDQESPH